MHLGIFVRTLTFLLLTTPGHSPAWKWNEIVGKWKSGAKAADGIYVVMSAVIFVVAHKMEFARRETEYFRTTSNPAPEIRGRNRMRIPHTSYCLKNWRYLRWIDDQRNNRWMYVLRNNFSSFTRDPIKQSLPFPREKAWKINKISILIGPLSLPCLYIQFSYFLSFSRVNALSL